MYVYHAMIAWDACASMETTGASSSYMNPTGEEYIILPSVGMLGALWNVYVVSPLTRDNVQIFGYMDIKIIV